jgi:DNA-binding winged helix-turn-helix (wHTH) protein/Tol biopolymer transport system component
MATRYRFGEYVLDVQRHTLHRGEREIQLVERHFGVLKLLVENAGSVVSRSDLIDAVWRDVAVSDDSLARAVSDLRTALHDDASHARYIRTIHRQGYLFIAPVTQDDGGRSKTVIDAGRGRPWLRNSLVPVATAALVVTSALALWGLIGSSDDGIAPSQLDFTSWRLRALGPRPFTSGAIKPAFARSDNMLAVVAADPDTDVHSLFLLRPDGGEPLQLTRGIEVRGPSPEFTADDSHVIFTTYHSEPGVGQVPDVWMAPVLGGEPTLLLENASAASMSPDGTAIVYSAVGPDGTSVRVRRQDGADMEIAPTGFWPRWSPDGRWIAYTTSDPEGGDGTLHVVRPDGTDHRELTSEATQMYGLCWWSDSSHVIFTSARGASMPLWSVDIKNGYQRTVTSGPGACASPTLAADGRQLVFDFSQRRWYLFLAEEPGRASRQVFAEPGIRAVALSPESSRIAIAVGAEAQSPAVSVLDLRTMERRTLSGMSASALAWMPDGESVLVAAPAPDGISHWIWQIPVNGGLPHPLIKDEAHWYNPSPSPDGTSIAVVRRRPTDSELVIHHLEGGRQRTLARSAEIESPHWSPDGHLLAWSGGHRPNDLESGGVWVCPAQGGTPRRLTADGAWPVWEEDGAHLLFVRFLEHDGIWRMALAGGEPSLVRRADGELQHFLLEGLDAGTKPEPLMLLLSRSTGELYVLESPAL